MWLYLSGFDAVFVSIQKIALLQRHSVEVSRSAAVEMWRIEKLISVRVVGIIHGPGSTELHGLGTFYRL